LIRSITIKLLLAFLAVGLIGTVIIALIAWSGTEREFGNLEFQRWQEALSELMAEYYSSSGSWEGISEAVVRFDPGMGPGGRGFPRMVEPIILLDETGKVITSGQGFTVGETVRQQTFNMAIPIMVEGEEVGRFIAGRDALAVSTSGEEFLDRIIRVLLLGVLGAAVVAALLGLILARNLTKPLRELTAATQAVAAGDLEQQVPVRSKDELGQLAKAFNQMNANLARSRDLRRQMTADIAHELRTPLSVILAHTEGIEDGVLPPSQETFQIIHDETMRLSTMVEDLRTLSLAEAGELGLTPQIISPGEIIKQVVASHNPRAKQREITLEVDIEAGLPEIDVDPDRMAQVLGNLLDNAFRYTPNGGHIKLSAERTSGGVQLRIQDNGPGVEAEELSQIFNRFYRADKSRQRDDGGSGLGLAIAKSIVERHKGQIWAESKLGEGMTLVIEFPLAS
jgi:two-component system sensor histidine kinase BaeS